MVWTSLLHCKHQETRWSEAHFIVEETLLVSVPLQQLFNSEQICFWLLFDSRRLIHMNSNEILWMRSAFRTRIPPAIHMHTTLSHTHRLIGRHTHSYTHIHTQSLLMQLLHTFIHFCVHTITEGGPCQYVHVNGSWSLSADNHNVTFKAAEQQKHHISLLPSCNQL